MKLLFDTQYLWLHWNPHVNDLMAMDQLNVL